MKFENLKIGLPLFFFSILLVYFYHNHFEASRNRTLASHNEVSGESRFLKPLKFIKGEFCNEALATPRENLLVVLNWNVLKAYHTDGQKRHPKMLKIIADLDADFIGLQEVYGKKGQENNPDIENDFQKPLKEKYGLHYWYSNEDQILVRNTSPARPFQANTQKPNRPIEWGRIGGFTVKINHPDVPKVRFYNVHLSYKKAGYQILSSIYKKGQPIGEREMQYALQNDGAKERTENLKVLSNSILNLEKRESSPIPTILVGDFNSTSHLDWHRNNPYLAKRYPFLKRPIKFTSWENKQARSYNYMPWEESAMISNYFIDTYRYVHNSSDSFQWGATWTPMGTNLTVDRIDYQYLRNPAKQLIEPICSHVVGENSKNADLYLKDGETWPSDHRALLTIYKLGN